MGDEEVSNLIYLRGDPELRVLYCYIELLSFQNFIVKLNMEYEGEEFSKVYCHDVLRNETIPKEISLNMHREELDIIQYIGASHKLESQNRLNRLNKIIEARQSKRVNDGN